jgi:hypothetical protein
MSMLYQVQCYFVSILPYLPQILSLPLARGGAVFRLACVLMLR